MKNTDKIWNRRFILLFITNLLMMATFYASVPILPILLSRDRDNRVKNWDCFNGDVRYYGFVSSFCGVYFG